MWFVQFVQLGMTISLVPKSPQTRKPLIIELKIHSRKGTIKKWRHLLEGEGAAKSLPHVLKKMTPHTTGNWVPTKVDSPIYAFLRQNFLNRVHIWAPLEVKINLPTIGLFDNYVNTQILMSLIFMYSNFAPYMVRFTFPAV